MEEMERMAGDRRRVAAVPSCVFGDWARGDRHTFIHGSTLERVKFGQIDIQAPDFPINVSVHSTVLTTHITAMIRARHVNTRTAIFFVEFNAFLCITKNSTFCASL